MDLAEFKDRHAGETAWVFGKGPSLSGFDFKHAGKLRCAINDTIAHIPDCLYGFSNDPTDRWADVYRVGHTIFQPFRALSVFSPPACTLVGFGEELTQRRGTLGSALQILHHMGVRDVHLVGIDGGAVHAEGFAFRTQVQPHHRTDYFEIRSDAIALGDELGMTLHFHHPHTMNTDSGKLTVRFTRNTAAAGIHYEAGSTAELPPKTAFELIAADGAVLVENASAKPAPAPVETAEAKGPAREKAVKK